MGAAVQTATQTVRLHLTSDSDTCCVAVPLGPNRTSESHFLLFKRSFMLAPALPRVAGIGAAVGAVAGAGVATFLYQRQRQGAALPGGSVRSDMHRQAFNRFELH